METIKTFIKSHWTEVSYLVFGGLTTIVNYLIYFPLYNFAGIPATICTVLAWVAAVAFAYVTNKPFVFHSHDWSSRVVIPELTKFIGCRLLSLAVDAGILFLSVDLLGGNGNLWKIITSVFVIVFNYFASKFLIFK